MAQLDSITWLPQIIWFSIIFFTVYTFVYKEFAPLAFYSQNLRSKKIEKHYNSIVRYDYLNVSNSLFLFNNVGKQCI
jgi:hypothetical protein